MSLDLKTIRIFYLTQGHSFICDIISFTPFCDSTKKFSLRSSLSLKPQPCAMSLVTRNLLMLYYFDWNNPFHKFRITYHSVSLRQAPTWNGLNHNSTAPLLYDIWSSAQVVLQLFSSLSLSLISNFTALEWLRRLYS